MERANMPGPSDHSREADYLLFERFDCERDCIIGLDDVFLMFFALQAVMEAVSINPNYAVSFAEVQSYLREGACQGKDLLTLVTELSLRVISGTIDAPERREEVKSCSFCNQPLQPLKSPEHSSETSGLVISGDERGQRHNSNLKTREKEEHKLLAQKLRLFEQKIIALFHLIDKLRAKKAGHDAVEVDPSVATNSEEQTGEDRKDLHQWQKENEELRDKINRLHRICDTLGISDTHRIKSETFELDDFPDELIISILESLPTQTRKNIKSFNKRWLSRDTYMRWPNHYPVVENHALDINNYCDVDKIDVSNNIENLRIRVTFAMPVNPSNFWRTYGKDIMSLKIESVTKAEFDAPMIIEYVNVELDEEMKLDVIASNIAMLLMEVTAHCPNLKNLAIEGEYIMSIHGPVNLAKLQTFDCEINLSGDDWPIFGSEVNLRKLNVSLINREVPALVNLVRSNGKRLKEFSLVDSNDVPLVLSELLRELELCEEMEKLSLNGFVDDCVLEMIPTKMPNLTELSLGHSNIGDEKNLPNMTENGLISTLNRLPSLIRLQLSELAIPVLSSISLTALGNLKQLQCLELSYIRITPKAMESLFANSDNQETKKSEVPKITHLRLRRTRVGDSFKTLAPLLSNLTHLDLYATGLSNASLQAIFANNRKLKYLGLDASVVTCTYMFGREISNERYGLTELVYLEIYNGALQPPYLLIRYLLWIRLNLLHTISLYGVRGHSPLRRLFNGCSRLKYIALGPRVAYIRESDKPVAIYSERSAKWFGPTDHYEILEIDGQA